MIKQTFRNSDIMRKQQRERLSTIIIIITIAKWTRTE